VAKSIQRCRIRTSTVVTAGAAAEAIVAAAKKTRAQLVVMGTHGHTGLGLLFSGSVADAVSREAPCPVVTVRTPQSEMSRAS
jgi:nucleotide-binding universal stress UspA family protein